MRFLFLVSYSAGLDLYLLVPTVLSPVVVESAVVLNTPKMQSDRYSLLLQKCPVSDSWLGMSGDYKDLLLN